MVVAESGLEPVDVREYLRIIVSGKHIIAVTTILIVGAALFWTLLEPTTYRSHLELAVEPRSSRVIAGGPVEPASSSEAGIETELFVLRSASLRQAVEDTIGSVPEVEFEAVPGANVITITVNAATRAQAANAATAYADAYVQQRLDDLTRTLTAQKENLERRIGDLQLQLADPLLPPSVAESLKGRIYSLQTDLNDVETQLASPNAGARVV